MSERASKQVSERMSEREMHIYIHTHIHVCVYERARKERQETDRWIDETRKQEGGREYSDVVRRFISIILYFSQT